MKPYVLFAFCLTAACDNLAPAARIVPINLTNNPGTPLTATGTNVMTGAVWSPDGSRIYVGLFNTLDPAEHWGKLHEIVVATGQDRSLKDTVPLTSIGLSADGAWIYYTAYGRLYRLPAGGGSVELVRDSVSYFNHVSGDGSALVFGRPGSNTVWVVLQSGAATPLPRGHPVAFSPSGDEMAYYYADSAASGSRAAIVSLSTGALRPGFAVLDSGENWVETRWDGTGIQMLVARRHSSHGGFDFLVRRPAGGADEVVFADTIEGYG